MWGDINSVLVNYLIFAHQHRFIYIILVFLLIISMFTAEFIMYYRSGNKLTFKEYHVHHFQETKIYKVFKLIFLIAGLEMILSFLIILAL